MKGETYYRPSRAIIINHLMRKIEHFAAPEQYEKFDHLVRGLGRDGLLETSANSELVSRMSLSLCPVQTSCAALIVSRKVERFDRAFSSIPPSSHTFLIE
jgi:ribonuclease H2 subunit B